MIKIGYKTIIGIVLIIFAVLSGLRGYQLSTVITFSEIHTQIDENALELEGKNLSPEMKEFVIKAKKGLEKTNYLTDYSKKWIQNHSYVQFFLSLCLLISGILFLIPHELAKIVAFISLAGSIVTNFSLPLILVRDGEFVNQALLKQHGNINFFGLFLDVVFLVAIILLMNKQVTESNNSV